MSFREWLREVRVWVEDTGCESALIFLACVVAVVLFMTLTWLVNTFVT